jgi:hypothetical protein
MYKVETDLKKKLIRLTIDSYLKPETARAAIQEMTAEMRKLGPGFSTLVDFRKAAVLPPESTDVWVEFGKRARMMGLRKSARLLNSALMKAQVNWAAREAQNNDVVQNFTEEKEALAWLLS